MRRALAALTSLALAATLVGGIAPAANGAEPWIEVNAGEQWVGGHGFTPGEDVTVSRNGSPIDGDPTTVNADGTFGFGSPDGIEAGDTIDVGDGTLHKTLVVAPLGVAQIAGTTVSGIASPGATSVHLWVNDTDPFVDRNEPVTDGSWSIDVGVPGDDLPQEAGTVEALDPGASGAVQEADEDGDLTVVSWQIRNPWFWVAVGDTSVNGNDFEPGATVEVTVNGTSIGSATVEDWSDFNIDSPEPFEPGDVIVVTPSVGPAKTLEVSNIAIDDPIVDNVISGTGAAGAYVNLGIDCDGNSFNRNVETDAGNWSEDVGSAGDEDLENQTAQLVRGCGGNALDTDEDGDATSVDWRIANPQIVADLTRNQVGGEDFGGPVTVTITDGTRTETWDGDTIEYWDDGFGLWLYDGPYADQPWTLGPGQTITVIGPNGEATLDVADLVVEGWDDDTNEIWGTTDQAGDVTAEAMHADKEYDSFMLPPVDGRWRIGLVDIRVMDTGGVWQFDAEGDLTMLRLTYGPTRFLFAPLFQQIVGSDWVDGSTVTLTIDPADPGMPAYSATRVAGPLDCNVRGACPAWQVPLTGDVNVFFDLTDTGFQARAGDVITMTDGTTEKTLTVAALAVDLPDKDSGVVTGTTTSPVPGFLTVSTRIEGMCDGAHDVTPDAVDTDGSWSVSFSGECQVQPGSVAATETDEDGDQAWTTDPVIDLRVEPVLDHVWAAWWTPGNATLTIERGGSQVFSKTVATQNVLTRGSWNLDMWAQPVGSLEAPMMALFDLSGAGGFDIRGGDVITVADDEVTRSITVADLAVTGIDGATDTVTGTAAPGQQVGFHLWDGEEGFWGYGTTAGADGSWTFVFETGPGAFPGQGLDPGMNGQTFGPDNTTVIRWTVPSGLATSTAILGDAPDPSVVGQLYLVRVNVQRTGAGTGRPAGTVTIADGQGATCTDTTSTKVDNRTSSFSCTLRSTSAGTQTLTATFNPAAGWAPSSGTAEHKVKRAATSTTILNALALATKATKVGEAYVVLVRVIAVTHGSGVPAGPVTVSDGSATCTIAGLSAAGTGWCQLVSTSAGIKTITARYDGTADFGASKATATHRVR